MPRPATFAKIKLLENITFDFAEAGVYHSLAITKSNELYAWGRNMEGFFFFLRKATNILLFLHFLFSKGQIAPISFGTIIDDPQKVFQFDEKVKTVSTFVDHSLIVTETGKVYSFGSEKDAKINLGSLF